MRKALALVSVTAMLGLSACSGDSEDAMQISGSSTVAPITSAIARQGRFDVSVEEEGTTDGFERFCAGETVINNASTAISKEMMDECDSNDVDLIELPIGLDALTVVRNDYEITDDMAELATWIAEDKNAIGFMGIGNYLAADGEQRDLITNLAIDGVMPSLQETQSGNYPMARPLFIYVSAEAAEKDEKVAEFVDYYLDYADEVLPRVRFYAFDEDVYELSKQRWESRTTGAMFDGDQFGTDVVEAMQKTS